MASLIDTNIAIALRDREVATVMRIGTRQDDLLISVITHVELEGGVFARPALMAARRASLDILMLTLDVVPFEGQALTAYSRIVAACGYTRSLILDRMIAATALVHDLTLVTANGADFQGIPGLKLEVWDAA